MKIDKSGLKVICVPVSSQSPVTLSGETGTPFSKVCSWIFPSRWMVTFIHSETAFTADTPTPCSPPDTLYELLSNLPPACSFVIITSAAEILNSSCMPTGMPRPKSRTDKVPPELILTSILLL